MSVDCPFVSTKYVILALRIASNWLLESANGFACNWLNCSVASDPANVQTLSGDTAI
jgi:hypothetical protein